MCHPQSSQYRKGRKGMGKTTGGRARNVQSSATQGALPHTVLGCGYSVLLISCPSVCVCVHASVRLFLLPSQGPSSMTKCNPQCLSTCSSQTQSQQFYHWSPELSNSAISGVDIYICTICVDIATKRYWAIQWECDPWKHYKTRTFISKAKGV